VIQIISVYSSRGFGTCRSITGGNVVLIENCCAPGQRLDMQTEDVPLRTLVHIALAGERHLRHLLRFFATYAPGRAR
jgi:hypothetical protein